MKTNLNREINSQQDVEAFIKDLMSNEELFHPDDDANDVEFDGVEITDQDRDALNVLMLKAREFVDPSQVAIDVYFETLFDDEKITTIEDQIKELLELSSDMRKAKEAYLDQYELQHDALNKEIDDKQKRLLSVRKQIEDKKEKAKKAKEA